MAFNPLIFHDIDTEEKAYWLGFLYADGYVRSNRNEIGLGLKESDLEHVEKFRNFIGKPNKIQRIVRNVKGKEYIEYRYCIANKQLKLDLCSAGCVPRKSLILEFPNERVVSPELINHFIRGYFDGDGSISLSHCRDENNNWKVLQIQLAGTYNFLSELKKRYDFLSNYSICPHGSIYILNFSKQNAVAAFLKAIYEDASVYLQRKYDKAKSSIKYFPGIEKEIGGVFL